MYQLKIKETCIPLPPWEVSCLQQRQERKPYRSFEDFHVLGGQLVMEPPPSAGDNSRYMDLRSDFAFKHIFGKEANKDLLIHFLNSLFRGRKKIRDIRFCPTERLGEDKETRAVIYDVLCMGEDGVYFLIEMQRVYQDFFEKRIFHYSSRLVSEQVPAGKAGDDFDVKEVYMISLLDFLLWEDPALMKDPVRRYLRSADVTWKDTREPLAKIEWIFIQLPAFDKEVAALETDLEKWIYLVNKLSQTPEWSAFFDGPAFRKLFKVTEVNKLNKEEQKMYKLSIDTDRDWRNVISHATRKGRMEGEKNKDLTFVQSLIKDTDFSDQRIATLAGVEEDFVRKVRSAMAIS